MGIDAVESRNTGGNLMNDKLLYNCASSWFNDANI